MPSPYILANGHAGRMISKIIVHCSDSEFGDAKDIDQWHKERGWNGIGYHYVILNGFRDKDKFDKTALGVVENGRTLDKPGAHCEGQNKESIGICLIGTGHYHLAQIKALVTLIGSLRTQYNLAVSDVFCHNQFSGKACPGFDIETLRGLLLRV